MRSMKNSIHFQRFQAVREIGEAKVRVAEYLQVILEKYQERVAKDLAEFKAELEAENPGETELIEKSEWRETKKFRLIVRQFF